MAADHTICPGSKSLRQPKPELFVCPSCGGEVEIWSDEIRGTCPECGATMMRDGTMSCLDWCSMGRDCVGDEVYESYRKNRAITVKQKLLGELESLAGIDDHALVLAREASIRATALSHQREADHHIVVAACILRTLEDDERIKKILLREGFSLPDVDQVCEIIGALRSGVMPNTAPASSDTSTKSASSLNMETVLEACGS